MKTSGTDASIPKNSQHETRCALNQNNCTSQSFYSGSRTDAIGRPELTSQMYHELLGVALHGGFYTLRAATRHSANALRQAIRAGHS